MKMRRLKHFLLKHFLLFLYIFLGIFLYPIPGNSFIARSNVPEFFDPAAKEVVDKCYGCHNPNSNYQNPDSNSYNPKVPYLDDQFDHHPMGSDADTSRFQITKSVLSPGGELYCESCHEAVEISHQDNFTKHINRKLINSYDPQHPNEFCIVCHSHKKLKDLNLGHLQSGKELESDRGYPMECNTRTKSADRGESCFTCHTTHNATGPKNWGLPLPDDSLALGVKRLCMSCHNGTISLTGTIDVRYENINGRPTGKGTGNVFLEEGENHVMHGATYLEPGDYPDKAASLIIDLSDPNLITDAYGNPFFKLDPNDSDRGPPITNGTAHGRIGLNYMSGLPGFYCSTCHNRHSSFVSGRAYLRYYDNNMGNDGWRKRKKFCSQCHGLFHNPDDDCLDCHAPHSGTTDIEDQELSGRLILNSANCLVWEKFPIGRSIGKILVPLCYSYNSFDLLIDCKEFGNILGSLYQDPDSGSFKSTYWFFSQVCGEKIKFSIDPPDNNPEGVYIFDRME